MYLATLRPYLDKIDNQRYHNIITINMIPSGPLKNLIKKINHKQLGDFRVDDEYRCLYGFKNIYSSNKKKQYMTSDDIPELIHFLFENNYEIDYELSKLPLYMKSCNLFFIKYTQQQ